MLSFFVAGTPAPQGSKSAYAVRRKDGTPTGKINQTEQNKATRPWRATVTAEAVKEVRKHGMLVGPVNLNLTFVFDRPPSHLGTGRNAGLLRPSAPEHMAVRPDADKLVRAVCDSLTDAKVWAEDSRVVSLTAEKLYASTTPGTHDRAGVYISVTPA